ncbi:hypothetical protein VTL71DRAFT_1631 [Oculimacula yallundae]|uniref:Uncharacterized protein n=1 Tax=Oculimacula yallundae TaxID=86028 RepID=A0ABR4CB86_9HELO
MESEFRAPIVRKPVNTNLGQNSLSSSLQAKSFTATLNSTTQGTVAPDLHPDTEAIALSRVELGQLVDALTASVSLLQAGLRGPTHNIRQNIISSESGSGEHAQPTLTTRNETEYNSVQVLSAPQNQHRMDLLENVFRQGSGPWFFEEYANHYGTEPFTTRTSSHVRDQESMLFLRRALWELLIGHMLLSYEPVVERYSHLAYVKDSVALLDRPSHRPYPLSQPVTRRSMVNFNQIALFVDVLSANLGIGAFPDETPLQIEHRLRMLVAICQANGVYTNCGCLHVNGTQSCEIRDYSHEEDCDIWTNMNVGTLLTSIYQQGLLTQPTPSDLAGHRKNAARVLQSLYPLRFFTSHFDWVDHFSSKKICPTATNATEIMQLKLNDLALLARKSRPLDWVRAIGTQFAIKLINVDNLQLIGGINIQWTDNLYEHLELSFENYPVLKIYWFAWATLDLPISRIGSFTSTTREELLSTYQLLFGVSDPGFLRNQSQRPVKRYSKIETHPNIKRRYPYGNRARELEGDIVTRQGRPYDFGADYHLPTEETHVSSFGTKAMQQDLYEKYPAFEDNLRIVVAYMDSQKPGGLRGLWYDKRDSGAWYTFWAVLWIGGISLIIGLLSLVASIAQSVASFKSLNSDPVLLQNGTVFIMAEGNVTKTIEVFVLRPSQPTSSTNSVADTV